MSTMRRDTYNPPTPLIIESSHGSLITARDFVIKVHEYVNENNEETIQVIDEVYYGYFDLVKGRVPVLSDYIPEGKFSFLLRTVIDNLHEDEWSRPLSTLLTSPLAGGSSSQCP